MFFLFWLIGYLCFLKFDWDEEQRNALEKFVRNINNCRIFFPSQQSHDRCYLRSHYLLRYPMQERIPYPENGLFVSWNEEEKLLELVKCDKVRKLMIERHHQIIEDMPKEPTLDETKQFLKELLQCTH